MAKSLKTNGVAEIQSFRKRVIRQHALRRITTADKNHLLQLVNQIEARLAKMQEVGENYQW